jgi:hypothetical protein
MFPDNPKNPRRRRYQLARSLALCLVLIWASESIAATVTYIANGTSSGGETQKASVTFTTAAGTLNVTLNDLISNPISIGQNISGLRFTLSDGSASGSLISSSGVELTVNSNRTYLAGSAVSTGWLLSSSGNALLLEGLGAGTRGPKHTIIGTSSNGSYFGGTFSNANGSIKGNVPHNPFLESGATFELAIAGLTAADTITSATFSFGTAPGDTLDGKAPGLHLVPEANVTVLIFVAALIAGLRVTLRKSGQ